MRSKWLEWRRRSAGKSSPCKGCEQSVSCIRTYSVILIYENVEKLSFSLTLSSPDLWVSPHHINCRAAPLWTDETRVVMSLEKSSFLFREKRILSLNSASTERKKNSRRFYSVNGNKLTRKVIFVDFFSLFMWLSASVTIWIRIELSRARQRSELDDDHGEKKGKGKE